MEKFIQEQMALMGFRVWCCRQGDRIYLTAKDPELDQEERWDEVYPVVLDGSGLISLLWDGDCWLTSLPKTIEGYLSKYPELKKLTTVLPVAVAK